MAAPAAEPEELPPTTALSQPRTLLCRRTGIGFVSAADPADARTLGVDDPAPSLEPDAASAAATAATAVAAEAEESAAASAELSPDRVPPRKADDASGTALLLVGPAGKGVAAARGFSPAPAERLEGSEEGDATAAPSFADVLPPRWDVAAPPLLVLLPRPFLPCAYFGVR